MLAPSSSASAAVRELSSEAAILAVRGASSRATVAHTQTRNTVAAAHHARRRETDHESPAVSATASVAPAAVVATAARRPARPLRSVADLPVALVLVMGRHDQHRTPSMLGDLMRKAALDELTHAGEPSRTDDDHGRVELVRDAGDAFPGRS